MKEMERKRNIRIDIIKGIGIVLMVLGHSGFPATHFIYLFHMAIFFIISGSLYQDKYSECFNSIRTYVFRKFKMLYLPYVAANLLFTLLNNVFIVLNIYTNNPNILVLEGTTIHEKFKLNAYVIEILKTVLMIGGTEMGGALWFLRVLLIISIIYILGDYVTRKIVHQKIYREVALGFIALIFLLLGYILSINSINLNGLSQAFSFFILYYLGKEISCHPKLFSYTENVIGTLLACTILIFMNRRGTIALDKNLYENPLFLVIVSLAGYILMNNVAKFIEHHAPWGIFSFLGKNTMAILIWHFLSFKIVNWLGIYLYHYPKYYVARFPVLLNDGVWWILYSIVGIVIPIMINLLSKITCNYWKVLWHKKMRKKEDESLDKKIEGHKLMSNDWIKSINFIFAFILAFMVLLCTVSFGHSDLLVTAQRSLLYIEGSWKTIWGNLWDNIAHFYTNAYQLTGDYGANYLPSTFLLFAIWNIPYKLFANASMAWGDWSIAFQLWNKLLPILFYVMACIAFCKICRSILHLDTRESRWGMLAYAISPVAFFGQFIFCQYDIFTVFFMVLGLYYYFKEDRSSGDFRKFILFMGISSTFKYFTLVILAVLLILENKNVVKCVGYFLLGCVPIFIEGGFYFITDRDSFTASVIEFNVLEFAKKAEISVGFAQIRLLPLAICLILLLAFKTHIADYYQRLQYGIFFCVCICAALFGLMSWHPQWILFAIPFWTLALITNKNKSFLITLDIAFSVCYIGYVVSKFTNNVDQSLFKYGIFTHFFRYKTNIPVEECMKKYFPLDTDLMFTAMVAIMVAYCVLSHPKNQLEDADMPVLTDHAYGIMVRFAIGVLVFLVPAGLCVPRLLENPELLWKSWSAGQDKVYATNFLTEEDENTVQYVQGVEGTASEVYAYTVCPYGKVEGLQVSLSIIDVATGNCEGYSVVEADNIGNNEMTIFSLQDTVLDPERLYEFIFNCNQNEMVHMAYILEPEYGRSTIDSVKRDHDGDVLAVDHIAYNKGTLYMHIEGKCK